MNRQQIHLRISVEDHATLKEVADREGETLAVLIRRVLHSYCKAVRMKPALRSPCTFSPSLIDSSR
jgi:hypothetical protein